MLEAMRSPYSVRPVPGSLYLRTDRVMPLDHERGSAVVGAVCAAVLLLLAIPAGIACGAGWLVGHWIEWRAMQRVRD